MSGGFSLFRSDLEHIVREAEASWPALAGGSILVTGGTGFFGMWLVEGLLWADTALGLGLHVSVLSRDGARFLAGRGRHLAGHPALTVLTGEAASFAPGGRAFTHIIHAVTESHAGHSAARHLETALGGTAHVIDIAAEHGTGAVLLTSSGAVYRHADPAQAGAHAEGPAGRADYTGFAAVYAEAKRMAETMLAAGGERHGFRGAIARCFAFSGAWLPLDGGLALGDFLRDALAGRDVAVSGDGTALRSYLYGADLVVWLLAILTRGADCRPYNVGSAEAVSIAGLAGLVAEAAGRPGRVIVHGRPAPGTAPHAYLPDVRRATEELGLRRTVGLEDSIRRSLAWYRGRA